MVIRCITGDVLATYVSVDENKTLVVKTVISTFYPDVDETFLEVKIELEVSFPV